MNRILFLNAVGAIGLVAMLTGAALTDYGICIPASSTGTYPTAADCTHGCHPSSGTCPQALNTLTWSGATCDGNTPECVRELKIKPSYLTLDCPCDLVALVCTSNGVTHRVFQSPPEMVLDCH